MPRVETVERMAGVVADVIQCHALPGRPAGRCAAQAGTVTSSSSLTRVVWGARGLKEEKLRILDEFMAVTDHHRKHVIRLINAVCSKQQRSTSTNAAGVTDGRETGSQTLSAVLLALVLSSVSVEMTGIGTGDRSVGHMMLCTLTADKPAGLCSGPAMPPRG